MWCFPFSSAEMTQSCGASPLIQSILLYCFDCYSSGFQRVWCFFFCCPSATSSVTSFLQGCCAGVPRRRKDMALKATETNAVELSQTACVPVVSSRLCHQVGVTCPFSICWQLFAVLVLSFQIQCPFSSSAKSKWTACSDMSTNMAPLPSDSPMSTASKPNNGWDYLKTALGFHHPFIHLWYKNNTLFYLWE